MPVNIPAYKALKEELDAIKVTLVAVSKTRPVEEILELYKLGQKDFGENYVQEMIDKQSRLPADIRWHFIGHLQSNKVKLIIPFVQLIQAVDSLKLLEEINKQGAKINRNIDCLLQVYIAEEETKFGFNEKELEALLEELKNEKTKFPFVRISGLMGMASFTDSQEKLRKEFRQLKSFYDRNAEFSILSAGMTQDYNVAISEGSTMVRIGSLLFGERK